jgi:hypothetical protein
MRLSDNTLDELIVNLEEAAIEYGEMLGLAANCPTEDLNKAQATLVKARKALREALGFPSQ